MQALQAHEDLAQLKAQSQLLILQFARPQCAPCASLAMRLDEWAQSHPQATLRYIDISQWPQVAAQEQILSVPTLQVYIDGRRYLQEAGYFSLDLLLDKLDHYWELRQDTPE